MNNPIIQRELIGLLRTRQALFFQVGLAVLLAVLVYLRWPANGAVDLAALQSQQVLRFFGYGMVLGSILLTPIFPAVTIVSERRRGTLILLINSPMSPLSIFFGKLLGTLGFALLLLVLSLPAAAAAYTMGGISLGQQMVPLYLMVLVAAVEYSILGLLVSTFASTPESAVRIVYGAVAALNVVPLILYAFLTSRTLMIPLIPSAPLEWVRAISPIPAAMHMVDNGDVAVQSAADAAQIVSRALWVALILSAVFAIWTVSRLNTRLFDRARAAGKITDDRSAMVRAYRRIMYLWFLDPQRRTGLIGPMTNPVMVKEMRSRRFGRMHWLVRLAVAALIISLALMLAASRHIILDWGATTISVVVVLLQMGLIVLITPTLACGLISGERETGGWPLLQMTPLSAGTIVRGKVLSVAAPLLIILLATLPAYGMMRWIDAIDGNRVPGVILSLLLTAIVALLVSAACSSIFKRTSEATAAAFAVLIGLWGGTLLLWAADGSPLPHRFVEICLMINPLAAALSVLRNPWFENYNLVPQNWWIMISASVLCVVVLVLRTRRLSQAE